MEWLIPALTPLVMALCAGFSRASDYDSELGW